MVQPETGLKDRLHQLLKSARGAAFDSYIRRGYVPDIYTRIADLVAEAKALGNLEEAPMPALLRWAGRPTKHYVWRTAGDGRVRQSHAVHNGQVFAWSQPPEQGHPGSEPNCRCWAEPYYGDPIVPDAMLAMVRNRMVNAGDGELWASIETVTRPDGSLANSVVVLHDGTIINSTLQGTSVTQVVSFPDTLQLQVTKDGDVRSFATGDAQSLEVAWLGRALFPRFLTPLSPPVPAYPPTPRYSQGQGQSPADQLLTPSSIILRGATLLYQLLTSAPQAMGASPVDTPAMAFGAWDYSSAGRDVAPVMTGVLSREQTAQFCPLLPQVQAWADEAAAFYGPARAVLGVQVFGTKVHSRVKKAADALGSPNLKTEYTIDPEKDDDPGRYGTLGSLRLDVIDYNPTTGMACVYDIKTGNAHLTSARIRQIAVAVAKHFGIVGFVIIEVKPGE